MSASIVACLLIVSLVGGTLVTVDREEHFTPQDLATVFESLDLILRFFARNSDQVNLDAVLGTRIVEGQMRVVWEKLLENRTTSKLAAVANEVFKLYSLANQVSDNGEASVKDQQPAYYKKLHQMIGPGFWELNYDSRELETFFFSPSNGSDGVKEFQSDNCLAELLGSPPDVPKCDISDYCWTMMTSMNYRGYSLTHEVIYLQIGELMGCWPEMVAQTAVHAQPSPEKLGAIFCSRVMDDALSIETGRFPNEQQDLFMEQIGICGMLGFRDFAKKSWLDRILSWQRPVGCFGLYQNFIRNFRKFGFNVLRDEEEETEQEEEDPNNNEVENIARMRRYLPVPIWTRIHRSEAEEHGQPEVVELMERMRRFLPIPYWPKVFLHPPRPQQSHRRFKREEKRMSHNCLAHKTAVAGVALSAFVRFIIEDLMSQWLL